jgi:hypothetical protein
MALQTDRDGDENVRLIRSLLECVNSPLPMTREDAMRPFQWALETSRERKKSLRHRVNFHADDPQEQGRILALAKHARSIARGILWWLATSNDYTLPEPVLPPRAGRPKVWFKFDATDVELLETPMVFHHFKVSGDTISAETLAIWDRPSTCIAHALDLLLTDYRGLRGRVRACPYIDASPGSERGDLSLWNAEQIGRDHALHFFVDDRFQKGQVQYYCSAKHRQTAYMRRYRSAE